MARIRSLKPEFWTDEELAVGACRDARMLYMGMWNLADEHGRLRGDPRFIKGQVFAYDDDLTPDVIDKLLDELAAIGKVVRYRVGGARYAFLPRLAAHQRLEADKVPSRLPAPEDADPEPPPEQPEPPRANKSAPGPDESESRAKDHALLYGSGIRGHGSGIPPTAGAHRAAASEAQIVSGEIIPAGTGAMLALVPPPADDEPDDPPDTTQALIAEWLDHCPKRPPGSTIGRIGKQIKALLAEGIDPADIRAGLAAWFRKGADPSALPSFVNQVMNTPAASLARASPPGGNFDAAMQRARAKEAGL